MSQTLPQNLMELPNDWVPNERQRYLPRTTATVTSTATTTNATAITTAVTTASNTSTATTETITTQAIITPAIASSAVTALATTSDISSAITGSASTSTAAIASTTTSTDSIAGGSDAQNPVSDDFVLVRSRFAGKSLSFNPGLKSSLYAKATVIDSHNIRKLDYIPPQVNEFTRSLVPGREKKMDFNRKSFRAFQEVSFIGKTAENVYYFHFWKDWSIVCPVCGTALNTGIWRNNHLSSHCSKVTHTVSGDAEVKIAMAFNIISD